MELPNDSLLIHGIGRSREKGVMGVATIPLNLQKIDKNVIKQGNDIHIFVWLICLYMFITVFCNAFYT